MTYPDQRARSDLALPHVYRILGDFDGRLGDRTVWQASDEDDWYHATDAHTATQPSNIAIRVRSGDYLERFPNDVTIRYSTRFGNESEYDKIRDGHGDFMFYGFTNGDPEVIVNGCLVDLAALRASGLVADEPAPQAIIPNRDRSTFVVFTRSQLRKAKALKATWTPDGWQREATQEGFF